MIVASGRVDTGDDRLVKMNGLIDKFGSDIERTSFVWRTTGSQYTNFAQRQTSPRSSTSIVMLAMAISVSNSWSGDGGARWRTNVKTGFDLSIA